MTKKQIENEIEWMEKSIASVKEGLPYADHGAYGQDLDRIADMKEKVANLKCTLDRI